MRYYRNEDRSHLLLTMVTAANEYLHDKERMYNRNIGFAKLSALFNGIVALSKIGMGVYSLSVFLCISGFYNIGIGLAKVLIIKSHYQSKVEMDTAPEDCQNTKQYRSYHLAGCIILLSSIVYMGYCVKMLIGQYSNINCTMIVAIAIAAFTFSEIGISIRGVVVSRRANAPAMEAMKLINLTSSLISLVLAQAALMSFTYDGNASYYCGLTGVLFGGISAIAGAYMIIRAKRIMAGKSKLLSHKMQANRGISPPCYK